MESIGERLLRLRKAAGLTQTALALKSEVSQGTIGNVESGQRGYGKSLVRIARSLGVSTDYLECKPGAPGPGETYATQDSNSASHHTAESGAAWPPVPPATGIAVVGTAQLGDDGYFYELEYPVGHGDGTIDWNSRDENAYCVRCKGESMKPRIRHNEYVVIEPNHAVVPGDEVLVRSTTGKVMVKQLAFIRDGLVHLDSVNESFARISINQEDVAVIHYVAGIAKSALWSPSMAA